MIYTMSSVIDVSNNQQLFNHVPDIGRSHMNVIIMGASHVGKTSLVRWLSGDTFADNNKGNSYAKTIYQSNSNHSSINCWKITNPNSIYPISKPWIGESHMKNEKCEHCGHTNVIYEPFENYPLKRGIPVIIMYDLETDPVALEVDKYVSGLLSVYGNNKYMILANKLDKNENPKLVWTETKFISISQNEEKIPYMRGVNQFMTEIFDYFNNYTQPTKVIDN